MKTPRERLQFKFLMIGNTGVGKTSLIRRLCLDQFTENFNATVGVEFMVYKTEINNTKIQLHIWDTAGQEQYRALGRAYYNGSIGVLLVFSMDNHDSFSSLENWMADVQKFLQPQVRILLVCNKSDLNDKREVTSAEIDNFCRVHGIECISTSAKLNTNVAEAFNKAARSVLQGLITNEIKLPGSGYDIASSSDNPRCC